MQILKNIHPDKVGRVPVGKEIEDVNTRYPFYVSLFINNTGGVEQKKGKAPVSGILYDVKGGIIYCINIKNDDPRVTDFVSKTVLQGPDIVPRLDERTIPTGCDKIIVLHYMSECIRTGEFPDNENISPDHCIYYESMYYEKKRGSLSSERCGSCKML